MRRKRLIYILRLAELHFRLEGLLQLLGRDKVQLGHALQHVALPLTGPVMPAVKLGALGKAARKYYASTRVSLRPFYQKIPARSFDAIGPAPEIDLVEVQCQDVLF